MSAPPAKPPAIDVPSTHARVAGILNRHPAVGLAFGVVRGGRLEFFHGHGFADIASRTPVTEDTVFRIGSITKTITAIAVLQLRERGLIDLDAPATDYLRAYTLVPARAGHPLPTVRQLLTHTAGLPELVYPTRALLPVLGETVPFGHRVPTLAEFYRGRLHLTAEPGRGHVYSNHGFATLGQIVEDVSARPLARYLRDHVFAPLGMAHTDLTRSARVAPRLATGYSLRAPGPRPVADRDLVTIGGGAVYSTTRDMARYVAALLDGGGGILRPETLGEMYAPQYRPDPRLPGVGLAFFRHDAGGHLVVQHDGLMPGFWSELSMAPGDGVGVIAFTNGTHGGKAWLGLEVSRIVHDLLGAPEPVLRGDIPQHPEVWPELCGRYSFRASPRDVQRWFVAGAKVHVRRGRLVLRMFTPVPALARGLELHPDDPADPYVFRVDLSGFGLGTCQVVFDGSPGTGASGFHVDVAPLSFDKR